ncbi:MAG: hypothetical protein ACR2RV_10350 [Verrucomicrobiales bacterium]
MNSRAKIVSISIGLICSAALSLRAEDKPSVLQAGIDFQKTCMGCHVAPDLRFATDRAWIDQIRETD